MFGTRLLQKIDLCVADARDLEEYKDNSFDAPLEKGTPDAVKLSGGKDKEKTKLHLSMAVSALLRLLKKGVIMFSLSACLYRLSQRGVFGR